MNLTATTRLNIGLEGVPVAETALSHPDGEAGRLILCGQDLADFVARHSFESAAGAFWATANGTPPEPAERIREALGHARVAAFAHFERLSPAFEGLTVAEGVRLGLASLAETATPAHIAVTAAIAVFTANLVRRAANESPVRPRTDADHVEDFLRMLRGAAPPKEAAAALSTYLLTVLDHGMNASTFAARVIASTHAGLIDSTVGAFAALTGPLHGGAPEPVLDMLDAIEEPERAADWIQTSLAKGERIMGFGHRVYRVRDPRADVLEAALNELAPAGERLDLARAVEAAALAALKRHKPARKLETNVEFYTAMLLDALGIPRKAFTPTFAIGRVVGWTAHALEQRRKGRLIRPASVYVG